MSQLLNLHWSCITASFSVRHKTSQSRASTQSSGEVNADSDLFRCSVPLHWFAVNFDPTNVRESAKAVPASWCEIDEADLLDFAEICLVEQHALGLDLFDFGFSHRT